MTNKEKFKDDPLWQYISPDKLEEAPEGFTSKVMTRINLDTIPIMEGSRKKNLVPYISLLVTILLITAAFLIPEKDTDLLSRILMSFINGIGLSFPKVNLSSIFQLSIPAVITYALIGILVLTVFDRALYGFFKKEK
jgi:hypothetical protein